VILNRNPLQGGFLPILSCVLALFLATHHANAIIDATLQMQLGNPSNATNDPNNHSHYLILRPVEAIDYNDSLGLPNWASWDLTTTDIGSSGRSPNFFTDTNLPAGFYQVTPNDYSGSGYDRGHMCPSADRTDTVADNDMVFYMSNIIPQAADNNEGIWANFEDYCRSQAQAGNELLITCGPGGFDGSRIQPSGKVAIPSFTWKVAVVVPLGGGTALSRITTATRVITIEVPNSNGVSTVWQNFVTSAGQVEHDTGLTFFTALPGTVASALRSRVDGLTNPPAAITSFLPTDGTVNTNVVITGTNLTSAYSVAFDGTPAVFSVDSDTQITAQVPANATSGAISITTPSSTATSSSSFTVLNSTNLDLAILCSHTGSFTQGDIGRTYTLVVTNTGAVGTTGAVMVSNALPAGLTATGISGTGWTTDLGTLTCQRSDSLPPGAAFPAITLTVDVAANAPASVTNVAFLSGGGDTNAFNNTANDPTTIIPALTPGPDLAVTSTHTGSFIQGTTGVTYTITVTNTGTAGSSGTITVTDTLPAGLAATAITGTGWSTDLGTLTGTRSDALTASNAYPPIIITLDVATNAAARVTNVVTVSGGGDVNSSNNNANDPTTIKPAGATTLVGWDVSGLSGGANNFGASPLSPTTNTPNLAIVGLTRGSGIGTTGSAAQRAWGGNNFTNTSSASAITDSRFATFAVAPNQGYEVSFSAISKFDYRHSATGPASGLLQYQIDSGAFVDIAPLSYPSNTSAGGSISPIDLTAIAALQKVGAGTNVTFRIVNWGGTSSAGTWYIFDVVSNSAPDFAVEGTVSAAIAPMADLTLSLTHSGNFTQADPADTYVITVTNVGAGVSAGTITVADTLPAGLTATAINGSGWTTDLETLSCTRSDGLAAGGSFPPITVTVSVASDAPASVTNSVTVSGGGQTNALNDTATDPTTINPMTPIQAWRFQWFGTTANSGPAADTAVSSSDGMANLLKYALGLDPIVPTNNPVVVDVTTGYLRLTSPKDPDASDVSFHVEVTDTVLGPWTTNGTTVDQDTSTLLQVHDNTVLGAVASRFIRLHVTNP
jgi:uncharacterized repeat protein (TIGR01451 family)